jgi:hypothetical protein
MREKLHAAVGPLGREAFRFAGGRCQRMWLEKVLPAITVLGPPGFHERGLPFRGRGLAG